MATSNASPLSLEALGDGVAVVTYDVPGEAVNTLKASFADHFERVLADAARDPRVRAIVLASGKPDSFIAGADITMLERVTTTTEAEALCRRGHAAVARLASSPKPIVAAVHGAALGGGLELALACRARVLSDDPKTVVGLPEVQIGLIPGLNGLQRLAALAGLQVALDHGLTGKTMRPATAKRLGVADDVVPRAILLDVAAELARSLANGGPLRPRRARAIGRDAASRVALEGTPLGRAVLFRQARKELLAKTGGHYPAPERAIEVLRAFAGGGLERSKDVEVRAFAELVVSATARRLMEIFFATTALKKDRGVDGAPVEPRRVDKLGVLGAGLMGAGITYASIVAGATTRVRDRDDAALARGLASVARLLDARVARRLLTPMGREQTLALASWTTEATGFASADLVVEAVPEDLALKQTVLREVEPVLRDDAIFASNTSSIPIAAIASAARRPENVVGMHYFSPVHKTRLLEVVCAERTAPEVVATAVAVGKSQGKTVIVVRDGVGFYTTRVLGPYMNEAAWLLTEGASVEGIDRALVAWGFPIGPMALLDEVGLDVAAHVGPILRGAFGERIEPPPAVERLVREGRRGRKNERGLYLYGVAARARDGGKHADPSVYAALGLDVPAAKGKPAIAVEEVQMRCALQLVNEAFHCLGEGVLRGARDGDVGAVLGLGFPPFRGGPFRYTEATGAAEILRRVEGYHQRLGARWAPAPALVEAAHGKRLYG
jgi:3-hydroxyacyl-CoA dehydrogenase/enoyl-CoA hydratase/3-hydroxybutyryl-CoA epimerase